MELIDRYIAEVGRYLPSKGRGDVLAELRSSLEDTLEDRFGREATQENVIALLKEYGPPKKVAASYQPTRFLIGPGLYPLYITVIQFGLAALAIAHAVLLMIGLWRIVGPLDSFWATLGNAGLGYLDSALSFLAITTLIFAILERQEVKVDTRASSWNPTELPPIKDTDRVSRIGMAVGIAFQIVLLVLLNVFRDRIGFVLNPMSGITVIHVPPLNDAIPWISLSLILGIALDLIVLQREHWQVSTRLAKIALNLFGMVILYLLFTDLAAWIAADGLPATIPDIVPVMISLNLRWVAIVLSILILLDGAKDLSRIVRRQFRDAGVDLLPSDKAASKGV